MGSQMLELVTPVWHPWEKVTRFAVKAKRRKGPSAVSVWQRPNTVQLDLHNSQGTWSTWVNLTPDEALRTAQALIKAARAASAEASGE